MADCSWTSTRNRQPLMGFLWISRLQSSHCFTCSWQIAGRCSPASSWWIRYGQVSSWPIVPSMSTSPVCARNWVPMLRISLAVLVSVMYLRIRGMQIWQVRGAGLMLAPLNLICYDVITSTRSHSGIDLVHSWWNSRTGQRCYFSLWQARTNRRPRSYMQLYL